MVPRSTHFCSFAVNRLNLSGPKPSSRISDSLMESPQLINHSYVSHRWSWRLTSVQRQSLPGRASSNSGHVRYAPKAEESSLLAICLCGLMATHMTPFPRSSPSEGGTVPISKFSADLVPSLRGESGYTVAPCRDGTNRLCKARRMTPCYPSDWLPPPQSKGGHPKRSHRGAPDNPQNRRARADRPRVALTRTS